MRETALTWWRSLSVNERADIIFEWKLLTEDYRRNWTNHMIGASSSTVEQMFKEMVPNADVLSEETLK